jgi:catechol 2,3-dioxygenase-like lactoylglutathione lyase family enzyme
MMRRYGCISQGEKMNSELRLRRAPGLCLILFLSVANCGVALSQSIFTHAHLRVPEGHQAQAAQWYQRIFAGDRGEIGPGPVIRYHNGFVGTMANDGMAGDGGESVIDHIGMAVPDVRAAVALVRELGGEVRDGPRTATPNGGPLIAHVTDLWGGRFELVETDDAPGIHHIHLSASDADAMRDWFLAVFGGAVEDAGLPFHRIVYENILIQINQAAPDDRRAPSRFRATDHIGFRVPSLDEFRERLAASGYTPYEERPNPPGADLMFFEGMDGLHIEMTEPAGL